MRRLVLGLIAIIGGASSVYGVSCGTVGSPIACGLVVGDIQYSVSGFNFAAVAGTKQYQEGDVLIDISSGGGNMMVLGFSINPDGPSANLSFFVNSGQTTSFSLVYDVTITPVGLGTVEFVSPVTLNLGTDTSVGNAFGAIQFITSGGEGGCLASINVETQEQCDLSPTVGTTVQGGNIFSLTGSDGNIAILGFNNVWNASFTEGSSEVPEPSTFALLGLGLAALPLARRFRKPA